MGSDGSQDYSESKCSNKPAAVSDDCPACTHQYQLSAFSPDPCNCGDQTATLTCKRVEDGANVGNEKCSGSPPATTRKCPTCTTYAYVVTDWSACECGKTKTRSVSCRGSD